MKRSSAIIFIPLAIFGIVSYILFFPHQRSSVRKSERVFTVVGVIDGTTLALENGDRVAILGVVVPKPRDMRLMKQLSEKYKLPMDRIRKYSFESRYFIKNLVLNQRIQLEYDPKNSATRHRDPSGRILAYVWVTYEPSSVSPPDWLVMDLEGGTTEFGTQLNGSMVRGGFAFADTAIAYKYDKEYSQFQKEARENARGVWGINGAK